MSKVSWGKRAYAVSLLCATTAIALPAQTFTTLHSFNGTDGSYPFGGLVQASDGNLYGTTAEGGAYSFGTVFKMTTAGALTTIYSFCSQSNCADGESPQAELIQATDGNLYGTTSGGGAYAYGTVFKMTSSGTLTTLHSFCVQANCPDGSYPVSRLIQGTDGNFYGTTESGGAYCVQPQYSCGTIFKVTPTGALTTLHSFNSAAGEGDYLYTGLVQATNGNFYGTTANGGSSYGGTVFEITPSGALTTLYSFCSVGTCDDGSDPSALIQATNGNFYGTTEGGGVYGDIGTVFEITPIGVLTTLHSFNQTDGEEPFAGLIQGSDGNFYGTTGYFGGAYLWGTVFEIMPAGALTTLYSFCPQTGCADGSEPWGLIQDTNGIFCGVTNSGGAGGFGAIYSLSTGLGSFVETLPTSGAVGSGVAILGNSMTGATSVTFNGTAATFTVMSSSEISTTVPAGATTGAVQVTTPSGTLNSNVAFQVTISYASVAPTSLTFGNQNLGTTSAAQNVTLTNTGNATLTLTSIAASGDFAQTNNCGSSVAASANCTISVTFTPTVAGTLTAAVTITDNAGSGTQSIALSGTAQGLVEVPGNVAQIQVGANGAVFGINSNQQIYSYDFQTGNWVLLRGKLAQISVGADGALWGVNSSHQAYSYDSANNAWNLISGAALTQITTGYTDVVWGLSPSGQVYRYDPGIKGWDLMPGALAQIAIGPDGAVWGINSSNAVYHFNARKQNWDLIPGALLTQVAVGYGGLVWGVNASTGKVYQFSIATQSFALVSGTFTQVSVGKDGTVWAVDTGQADAYRYDPSATGGWDIFPMSAPISQISVGYAGAVWAADSSGKVYQLQPTAPASAKTLQQVTGTLTQVAATGDGNVWGLNSSGQVYAFNSATQKWELVAGSLSQIAVGFGGAVWGVNSKQQIYNFDPQNQKWNLIPGLLTQIAAGSANAVWGINASGQVYQYGDQKWSLRAGLTAVQIAVAADGTVWGLNGQQQIYSYDGQTQTWQKVSGLLMQIAVGSATSIWGINSSEDIYSYNTQAKAWDSSLGQLKQLGVGLDDVPWGFSNAGTVYQFNAGAGAWNQISGTTLSSIAVGADEVVWGLNGSQIYRAH